MARAMKTDGSAARLIAILCSVLTTVALVLAAGPSASAEPQHTPGHELQAPLSATPADYLVPGGWFYTQGAYLGDTEGLGFAVVDEPGAELWTAYWARGGPWALGYPISRTFEWEGRTAQAFEHLVLRWDAATNDAEVLPLEMLPAQQLPPNTLAPERPPLVAAELENKLWSGWWWPAWEDIGPPLFAVNGPLDKYDRYVARATGQNPATRAWELREMRFPDNAWAGHCNGWAAAVLLEPEPTEPREALGITFSVADLKGLLSSYHFADQAAWSFGQDGKLDPADFHRMLLSWLADGGKGVILTFQEGDEEFWNYPVYRFETAWGPHPNLPGVWEVTTTIWMASPDVSPNFVGLKPYPGPNGQRLDYLLEGDPRDPSRGTWSRTSGAGSRGYPAAVWYPEPTSRNVERQLASPNLDRGLISRILNGE